MTESRRFRIAAAAALAAVFVFGAGAAIAQVGGDTGFSTPIPFGVTVGGTGATTASGARTGLGAGPGYGVNVVTDYGADPTGSVSSVSAVNNALNAACNNASPAQQTKEVFFPAGVYLYDAAFVDITNACKITGQGSTGVISSTHGGSVLVAAASFTNSDGPFRFRGQGQLQISGLRIDVNAYGTGGASYARVSAAGAGYAVNDTITLTGGTFTTATVLKVTAISAGAVTGVVITTPGTYSVAPPATAVVAQGSTSGIGAGATFNVVYANNAAISISGPTTKLTADAASGATSLTVASIVGFSNGDNIYIEQDDGTYKATTVSGAPSGSTITLAGGLSFKASANHPVFANYGSQPLISDVSIRGTWDGIRIDNADFVTVRNVWIQDYGHDGLIKFSGPLPDGGGDRYQGVFWDLNRGTSNAGIELLAGGDIGIGEKSKFLGSLHNVLLNSYFGPTGSLLISNNSMEEAKGCAVRLHQSVPTKEYGNVVVTGNEFADVTNFTGQNFCIDAGTPNTAAKWVRNVNLFHNTTNGNVSSAVAMVSVQDGDNVIVAGNTLNNNGTAGPTGISIGGAATHVIEAGNEITGFGAAYGTMLSTSLDTWRTKGALEAGGALTRTATLKGGASWPIIAAGSGASGLFLVPSDDGTNAILRVEKTSASAAILSAVDATGVGSFQTFGLNGSSLNFQINSASVGSVTSTGLNSIAIGATTPSTGAFSTLSASGVTTPTGGLAPAGGFTVSPRNWATCEVGSNGAASAFTDQTPAATEVYIAEIFVPANATLTGVAIRSGSVASGNVKVGLANSAGTQLKTSVSTAVAGAAGVYQLVPFTGGTYAAVGPATYYVETFYDNATVRGSTHTQGACGTSKQTGQTYATGFTAISPPTTFTTGLGPVANLY